MKMASPSRRWFFHLMRFGIFIPVLSRAAEAQAYPGRPVRLMVGFPPGGPNDTLARLIGQWLSERLGQPFQVQNRSGSSGNIATEEVVRASPDGHTLLLVGPANAITAAVSANLTFDFLRDIAPIAGITREPLVMVVHPSVPARTVVQFLTYVKATPGALKMAATGQTSSPHVSGELFKMMAGIDVTIVQYAGGGPALEALIRGEAQMMFEPLSAAIDGIRSGKLRALAVTTAARCEALPDVPSLGESVAGVRGERRHWYGRAKGYTGRDSRDAQPSHQCRLCRFADEETACRHRRHCAARVASGVCKDAE